MFNHSVLPLSVPNDTVTTQFAASALLPPFRLALPRRSSRRTTLGTAMRRHKTVSLAGAALGLLLFLFVGLLPSLLTGGAAGGRLALELLGAPTVPSYGVNAFMVLGVAFAATTGAAFFALLGAAAGAALSVLTCDHAASGVEA